MHRMHRMLRAAGGVALDVALGVILGVALNGCPSRHPLPTPPPTPPPAEPPPPPAPPPLPTIPLKRMDTARLFSGIHVKTSLQADFGTTATTEREDPSSYELDLQVRVRVPRPHRSLEDLHKLNPSLSTVLPWLESALAEATVSPLFEEFYKRKVAHLQNNLTRLDALLSRHNFFDIETLLELRNPITNRRTLLIQSDMDVDTDGSDGDRVPKLDEKENSSTFQPFTSYRWAKKTQTPNPFLAVWEKRLKENEKSLATPTLSPPRQKELRDQQAELKLQIADLKKHSFLVGNLDPFIVLPLPMVSRKDTPPAAKIGDFCVLIHGNRLFPAVVGDAGPSFKSGEASLRICQAINSRSNHSARAESDLRVTYLVFPETALSPREPIRPEQLWLRCRQLLQEIGGYWGELVYFENGLFPPARPAWDESSFIGPQLEFLGPVPPKELGR